MCGFLAQFGEERDPLSSAVLERLPAALAHRGRDDFQRLSGPAYRMWSWRLALVDRLAGKQPMRSPDGKVTLLFNGEIYNYRALRSQLKESGATFRTDGDTEVVLEAYRQWGVSCFKKFEGMFAICLVDEHRKKILLGRDLFGIKPLYFCQGRETLWVASEPKALFAAAAASPALDPTALPSYLLFQTVLGTRTLFRSIQKVPPGCLHEFNLMTREPIGVHSTVPEESPPAPKNYEEAKAMTRQTLRESARLTFDTDLPLAFHLSGGLDSNLLISLFRHLHPGREVRCFSSLIEGEEDKEWAYIRQFAGLHGCTLEKTIVDAEAFFASLDEVTYWLDEPVGDPGVIPQFLVNKLCSEHGKVVMTGHGLDEMFFGYMRNLAASLLAERGVDAIDPQSERFRNLQPESRAFFKGWEGFLQSMTYPQGMAATLRYFRKLCRIDPFLPVNGSGAGALPPTEAVPSSLPRKCRSAGALRPELERLALETHDTLAREAPSMGEFMLAAETRIQLPALLQMEDRASMRYTVEARVPFCNPSVFTLAKKLPASWKLHGGAPKGLIRDAFREFLPPPVLSRKEKVGRPIPLRRWLEEPAGRAAREQLEEKRELFRDLTSCDLLQQAGDNHRPYDRLLWGLLSLSRWIDLYQVSV